MKQLCFSFVLGTAIAAASLSAADGPAVTETPQVRMTSVVRSDQRTGKLVRSMVVTPKSVDARKVAETVVAPRVVSPEGTPATPAAAPTIKASEPLWGNINQLVAQVAQREQLPPELLHSVIKVESNYDPNAVSPKGAQGLMQLIPETALRFGVTNAFSPAENIQGGAKYLRYLLELYNGDYVRALAAYNAGEGAVAKYGGVPPYAETRNYLIQVSKQLGISKAGQAQPQTTETKPAAHPETTPAKTDGVNHLQEVVMPDGTVRYVSK